MNHIPNNKYCSYCYLQLFICDNNHNTSCKYCIRSDKKQISIVKCQKCKVEQTIKYMYTNKEHCVNCQKTIIIELCPTHKDTKSVIKWKCCSLGNNYYCRTCAYIKNVRVCQNCRKVYCNNHKIIMKNGICSNCQ